MTKDYETCKLDKEDQVATVAIVPPRTLSGARPTSTGISARSSVTSEATTTFGSEQPEHDPLHRG
jgi:hypothetical protein